MKAKYLLCGYLATILLACIARAQEPEGQQQQDSISEIVVTGRVRKSLPKLLQPILTTPQQVVTLTAGLFDEFRVTDVQQALQMSSLVANHGNDAAPGNDVEIHGFTTQYDMYQDGLPEYGKFYRDTFAYDGIEIVEGPSSVLFGRGSTGAAINFNTKKPLDGDHFQALATFGTADRERIASDLNYDFGDGWKARLNTVADQHGEAGRPAVEYKRLGVFPEVSYNGGDFRFLASWLRQSDYDRPDYGIPYYDTKQGGFVALNAPHEADYGFSDDYDRTVVDILTFTAEYDLNDTLMLRAQSRWGNYDRAFQVTTPLINGVLPDDPDWSKVTVARKIQAGFSRDDILDVPIDLIAKFDVFGIHNEMIGGIEFQRIGSSPVTYAWSGVPSTSFLDPDPSQPVSGVRTISARAAGRIYSQGAYISDTMFLPWDLQLLLSARGDRFDATWRSGGTTFRHIDLQPSLRLGLVYPFQIDDRPASAYVAYGSSFDPQGEGLSLSSKTGNLAPEETENIEVGAKWQIGPKLLLSGDIFRTEKTNMRENDPNDPTKALLVGDGLARGIDLQLSRRLWDEFDMTIGYTYLMTDVEKSPNNDLGNQFRNAPRHNVAAFFTYEPKDYEVGAGLKYVSDRYASALLDANGQRFQASGYVTVGLMAAYNVTRELRLQLNVDNLLDEWCVSGVDDARATPCEGRSVSGSIRWKY